MVKLLEGKVIADQIKEDLQLKIKSAGKTLKLASIQVGDNPASEIYVKSQKRVAEQLGVEYQLHQLRRMTTDKDLVEFIQGLNRDESVSGIILQLPLPLQIDYKKISQFITPEKDVEGMHPVNLGKLIFGKAKILPCTAAAVMVLLNSAGIDLVGKEVVVVGHSEIVGKPLSLLLLEKLATVTVCHIGTFRAGKLEQHINNAEVLILAVGRPGLIRGEWVKEGAIVIDVGINKVGDKIVGDVDFEGASKRASWITPVPGGVGPLTVTMLMRNLVEAAKL